MKLGKKLYHSTSIFTIKLLATIIFLILFANLNFQTLTSAEFNQFVLENGLDEASRFYQVFRFHAVYPEEYIVFCITVLFPVFYYGFFRGVTFYEKGVRINKGLPFFNNVIFYNQIEKYEIIHPKFFLSITQKETDDDILFTVNNVDRVLAILDQNDIHGDLGKKARMDHGAHQKLLIFFVGAGILMAIIQYSGLIRSLLR